MSYKEFNIDNVPYEEYREEEINAFEKIGTKFADIFIEKPKEIRREIIKENRKELNKEIEKRLDIDENVNGKYLGIPANGKIVANLFAMLITMPGAFVTNFGDRNMIIETNKRLMIFTLGSFYDFLESVNIRYKDIEEMKLDIKNRIIFIKRKKVTNIHDYFFPKEWRIQRNLKITITSENYEKLFINMDKVKKDVEN